MDQIHGENEYHTLLKKILLTGQEREDRTNIGTISIFGHQMSFDISNSFPLLTTKFVNFKSVLHELLFFLRGETNSKILEDKGVSIWKGNTTREFLNKRGLHSYQEGEMGPMYGWNWRFFGRKYRDTSSSCKNEGYDQIQHLLRQLISDPFSRRHMITTFDPSTIDQCVLAPCHGIVTQFYVEKVEQNYLLSCHVYCRNSDVFLGLPFNIASYALLTYILAKKCNYYPYKLIISTGDTHIYNTHIEQVKKQLLRGILPFPNVYVCDSIKEKALEDISSDDFMLKGYIHHPFIPADMAV